MSVRIELEEGEHIARALRRLQSEVHKAYHRAWAKRRLGYHEKPSVLRRKRRRAREHNLRGHPSLRWSVGLERLLARTGRFGLGQ